MNGRRLKLKKYGGHINMWKSSYSISHFSIHQTKTLSPHFRHRIILKSSILLTISEFCHLYGHVTFTKHSSTLDTIGTTTYIQTQD